MSSDEQTVAAVLNQFYDAIEHLATGRGIEPRVAIWHHVPFAAAAHPLGDWAYGWEQVLATWKVLGSVGHPEVAGGHIRDLRVHVCGDSAYSTCIYVAAPAFNHATMNCTNVLQRIDGLWKIIHHHADKSVSLEGVLEKNAE